MLRSTSFDGCSVIHDAAERESTTVAKTSSDYYEDGTCVKVRLVRMQDLICDGGSGQETELDMQLATCPHRETSRAAQPQDRSQLRLVLHTFSARCFAVCCAADVQCTHKDRIPLHALRTPR